MNDMLERIALMSAVLGNVLYQPVKTILPDWDTVFSP